MKISYIMTIGSIIYLEGRGYIISGNVDFGNKGEALYIGEKESQIVVKSYDFYNFYIKDVRLSTSITGDFSLGILLYDSENVHRIKVGDKVYAIIEDK